MQRPVGAVIVDPEAGIILAQAASSFTHPLKHAVMVCIDAVARTQGGGAWGPHGNQCSLLQEKNVVGTAVISGVDSASKKDQFETITVPTPPAKKLKLSKQYLCTGYDAYVTMEPCIM